MNAKAVVCWQELVNITQKSGWVQVQLNQVSVYAWL